MWHAWEERKVYKVFIGKPEGKRPLGRARRRWEDGIKRDVGGIVWKDAELINLDQNRDWRQALVNTVMNLWILAPRN
jgi:hypothetical protein